MGTTVTYVKDLTIAGTAIPAKQASLSRVAEMTDNSNFVTSADGNTSRIVGLVDWKSDFNGDLGNSQGYNALLKKGGTPTSFTAEAATNVSGNIYQITDATKRVIDPDTALVIWDGSTPVVPTLIDYMFGTVTLSAPPSGTVTFHSGNYIPMTAIAQNGGAFSLDMTGKVLDATDRPTAQSNSGLKINKIGLIDIAFKCDRFDDLAGTYEVLLLARTPVLIEVTVGNASLTFRGWFVLANASADGAVDGQEMEKLEFAKYGKTTTNFSYAATGSLNAGIAALLSNFFARTSAAITYLPDGSNGDSGSARVASLTFDGDMSKETFKGSLVGASALTYDPV